MTTSPPADQHVRSIRPLPVVGGVAAGLLLCLFWAVAIAALAYGLNTEHATDPAGIALIVALLLPLVVSLALLLRARTRTLGGGFLVGMAIAVIAVSTMYLALTAAELF